MTWSLKEYAGPGPYASPTDRTSIIRSDSGSIRLASHAFRGESTDSMANLDDDAASRAFAVLKQWRFEEDASGAAKVIWSGRMMRPGVKRGDHFVGDARQFDLSWVDRNWDLTKLRIEADRPAETDVQRVQWLGGYILNGAASTVTNARERPSTVINVTTYVPNTNTVALPAKEISASGPWGVIDDCARASGKSWFVYVDDAGSLFLFYDLDTSVALACTLSITDQNPNFTTQFGPDPTITGRDIDGTEFLTGGAHVYGDGALVTTFDATAEGAYDVAEDTLYADASTSAEATAKLGALISERKVPEPQQRTRIWLPADKAHLVRAGMTISFRSAAAGVTTPTTFRITRTEHVPPNANGGLYGVGLELSYPKKMRPRLQDRERAAVLANKAIADAGLSNAEAEFTEVGPYAADLFAASIEDGVHSSWASAAEYVASSGWTFDRFLTSDGCGLVGLWGGKERKLAGLRFTLPADAEYVDGRMEIEYDGNSDNLYGGTRDVADPFPGSHILSGGLIGTTFTNSDWQSGELHAVIPDTDTTGGSGGPNTTVDVYPQIPGAAYGSAVRYVIHPDWAMGGPQCEQAQQVGGGNPSKLGQIRIGSADLYLRKLAVGTKGWLIAQPRGTKDGSNRTFTLIGGAERVSDVWRNGVLQPPSAYELDTVSGEIDTVGWAPSSTDLLLVRYFAPTQS